MARHWATSSDGSIEVRLAQFWTLDGSSNLECDIPPSRPRGRSMSSSRSNDVVSRSHDLERAVDRPLADIARPRAIGRLTSRLRSYDLERLVTPTYPSGPRPLGRHRLTSGHREIWTHATSDDASADVGHPSLEVGDHRSTWPFERFATRVGTLLIRRLPAARAAIRTFRPTMTPPANAGRKICKPFLQAGFREARIEQRA